MKNPCWEGYEAYGFKQKDGRRVPNCVPTSRMPYKIERWGEKGIVVNSKTGKHYSSKPLPLSSAKAQLRVLKAAEKGEKK